MVSRVSFPFTLLPAALCGLLVSAGCSSNKQEGPTAVLGSPEDFAERSGPRSMRPEVELATPQIIPTSPGTYRCQVSYKFTRGEPDASGDYTLVAQFMGASGPVGEVATKIFSGKDLKKGGGTLEISATPGAGTESVTMRFMEGHPESKTSRSVIAGREAVYRRLSNEVRGPILRGRSPVDGVEP